MRLSAIPRHLVLLACMVSLCSGTKSPPGVKQAKKEYERAQQLFLKGDIDAAIEQAESAKANDPTDLRYVTYVELLAQVRSARQLADAQRLGKSGEYQKAVNVLRSALQRDPGNPELAVAARDAALQSVQTLPKLTLVPDSIEPEGAVLLPQDPGKKRDFHLRGNTGQVLTDFFRQYGIAVQIDPTVQPKQLRLDITETDYMTALSVLLKQGHVFLVPASTTQVVAYNDTQENRNNYEHLFVQTFDVKEAGSPQAINELTNTLRAVFNFKFIGQTATGKLALKGSRAQVEQAAEFLEMALTARPELMLDINEIEISDSLIRDFGLSLPLQYQALNVSSVLQTAGISNVSDLLSQLNAGTLNPTALAALGGILSQLQTQNSGLLTFGGGKTQEAVLVPPAKLSLNDQRNRARTLQHISLRVMAGTAANYHDGLRYPVVSTTFSSLVNSALVSRLFGNQTLTLPPPAVQYVDLGITLKVIPVVQANRDVTLKFEMKVQNLTGVSQNQVPVIGSREFVGTVTLRQGESAVLAGLVEDTNLRNNTGIPGLSSVGLTAIGGIHNRNIQRNQILITVTPRTIRLSRQKALAFPVN